jgi:hypothetical protein
MVLLHPEAVCLLVPQEVDFGSTEGSKPSCSGAAATQRGGIGYLNTDIRYSNGAVSCSLHVP